MLPGPDSARSAPQYNIHESPAVYFKEAIREIRSRLKLCELYSYFFDDIANIEDMYGKLIVKVIERIIFSHIFNLKDWHKSKNGKR